MSDPPADLDRSKLQRLVVAGTSCAGKSTLAARLSEVLGALHVQLDMLHWLPGWVERDAEEFRSKVDAATAGSSWIVDGNYSSVQDLTWHRAQTIIWLDYSFPVIFSRALRRTARRCISGELVCNGNRETFAVALLSRDSILWWVLKTYRRRRREFNQSLFAPGASWQVIRLRSPAATRRFLTRLEEQVNDKKSDEE